MSETYTSRPGIAPRSASQSARRPAKPLIATAAAILCLAACSDSPVSYFDSPTSIPISTTGIQNSVMGLFGSTRTDQGDYLWESESFARDLAWFLGASPNTLTDVIGLVPGANANTTLICCRVWNTEYEDAKQANTIIASVPKVTSFTPPQMAAITGILQTIKALNFMYLAETRDTLGIPLYAIDSGTPVDPPYCNPDVWKYIRGVIGFRVGGPQYCRSDRAADHRPIGLCVRRTDGRTQYGDRVVCCVQSRTRGQGWARARLCHRPELARHGTDAHAPGFAERSGSHAGRQALTASALYNPAVIAPPSGR